MDNTVNPPRREKEDSLLAGVRVNFVIDYLLNHPHCLYRKKTADLANHLIDEMEKELGVKVSKRTMERYLSKARSKLNQTVNKDIGKRFKQHQAHVLSLLQRSSESGNIKLELEILKYYGQIEGLGFGQRSTEDIIIKEKDIDCSKLTMRQLDRIIEGEDPGKVLMSPLNDPKYCGCMGKV